MHTEQTTAVLTANEPPNGTKLILDMPGGAWKVIVRDDAAAAAWDSFEGERWFAAEGELYGEPAVLHEHIKYADAVYALGEKLAEFR